MATYSEYWGHQLPGPGQGITPDRGTLRRYVRRKSKKERALLQALVGAAAGAPVVATTKRIQHSTTELGGKRTIETVTLINRTTTNADIAEIDAAFTPVASAVFPVNKAGTNWNM